mmetsp:Transcript_129963/g.323884  ORF Transcript_129963/g.323884 Transcript_129963/m.323884 type:complete len:326 (-) Transcript_129963:1806-2783(-)
MDPDQAGVVLVGPMLVAVVDVAGPHVDVVDVVVLVRVQAGLAPRPEPATDLLLVGPVLTCNVAAVTLHGVDLLAGALLAGGVQAEADPAEEQALVQLRWRGRGHGCRCRRWHWRWCRCRHRCRRRRGLLRGRLGGAGDVGEGAGAAEAALRVDPVCPAVLDAGRAGGLPVVIIPRLVDPSALACQADLGGAAAEGLRVRAHLGLIHGRRRTSGVRPSSCRAAGVTCAHVVATAVRAAVDLGVLLAHVVVQILRGVGDQPRVGLDQGLSYRADDLARQGDVCGVHGDPLWAHELARVGRQELAIDAPCDVQTQGLWLAHDLLGDGV